MDGNYPSSSNKPSKVSLNRTGITGLNLSRHAPGNRPQGHIQDGKTSATSLQHAGTARLQQQTSALAPTISYPPFPQANNPSEAFDTSFGRPRVPDWTSITPFTTPESVVEYFENERDLPKYGALADALYAQSKDFKAAIQSWEALNAAHNRLEHENLNLEKRVQDKEKEKGVETSEKERLQRELEEVHAANIQLHEANHTANNSVQKTKEEKYGVEARNARLEIEISEARTAYLQLQDEIMETIETIHSLQQEKDGIQSVKEDLDERVRTAQAKSEKLQETIDNLNTNNSQLSNSLKDTRERCETLKVAHRETERKLGIVTEERAAVSKQKDELLELMATYVDAAGPATQYQPKEIRAAFESLTLTVAKAHAELDNEGLQGNVGIGGGNIRSTCEGDDNSDLGMSNEIPLFEKEVPGGGIIGLTAGQQDVSEIQDHQDVGNTGSTELNISRGVTPDIVVDRRMPDGTVEGKLEASETQ